MKHFLSLERLDVGRTLALTVGSPSAHRRSTMLKHIVFMLLFLLGSLNVWGADEEVYKQTIFSTANNSGNINNYTSSWTNTTNGFTVSIDKANNNNNGWNSGQIKIGNKNNASVGTIITNSAIDKAIIKVKLGIVAITTSKVNSIKLYYSSNGSSWTEEGSFTKATGTQEVAIAAGHQAANLYYKIAVDCGTGGNSNGFIQISQVDFYISSSGTNNPTLSLEPTSVSVGSTDVTQQTIALTASNFSPAVTTVTTGLYSNEGCTSAVTSGAWVKDITVNGAKTQVTFNVDDNTGAARQVWLKITASNGTKSADAILPISQAKYTAPTGTFNKYTGETLVEGEYVICSGTSTTAMKNAPTTGTNIRIDAATVTINNNNAIVNPDESVVWKLEYLSGDDAGYFTLYNEAVEKYAAFTSTDGRGNVIETATDYAKWQLASNTSYDLINKGKTGKYLRYNSGVGFASYASSTGATLTLYKKALPTHAVTFTAAPTGGTVAVSAGSAISSGAQVEEGTTVTVTPTPSQYYRIASVTKGGQAITPVQGVYSFTMPTSDVAIAVTFEYIPVTKVTVAPASLTLVVGESSSPLSATVLPNNALGTVTWSSANSNIASVNSETGVVTAVAASENPVNIIATSTVTGTVSGTCAVTVNAPTGNPVSISQVTGGTVTANVDVSDVLAGTPITLTATPAAGYSVSGWTIVGVEEEDLTISQDKTTCSFAMPDDEVLAEASFTHEVAVLKLHDANGESTYDGENTHYWKEQVTLPNTAAACSKTFMGWSADENRATAPEIAKGASYTIPNKGTNHLYAVYADITGGGTSTTNIAYSGSTTNMTGGNDAETFGLDADEWSLVAAKGGSNNFPGLHTDGEIRLYYDAKGGNTLTITAPQTITSVGLTFTGNSYNNAWVKVDDEVVALSDGVYPINATSFVIGNANTSSGQVRISNIAVNFTTSGTPSGYTTTCAVLPTATVDPEAVEASNEAVAAGVIDVTYQNVKLASVSVTRFNDEACKEPFDGEWLTASLNGDKDIAYTIFENTSYNDVRTAYIKLIAPQVNEATDPAVVVIPVTQAKKPAVFNSLQALVDADVNANTEVTVTFEDIPIKEFYYYPENSQADADKKGIVFEISKAGNNIKIYFSSAAVPSTWVTGGKVSGTLTNCPWKTYDNKWQLAPKSGWAWSNLGYEAPPEIKSIKIGGTATNKTYIDGQVFNPAGLTVTAIYDNDYEEDVTTYATWTYNPAKLSTTDTQVEVTAEYNNNSDSETITGLTVNAIPNKTVAEFIAAGGTRCYLEGIVSNIETVQAGTPKVAGYFDLTDADEQTIHIYKCLNASGEENKFDLIGVKNGDKVKVIAETYEYYNNETHQAKNVQYVSHISPVEITIDDKELAVGQEWTIVATTDPEGAVDNISYSIKDDGTSSNFVTLGNSGVVTGKAGGIATIVASIPAGEGYLANSVEFTVTVIPMWKVQFSVNGTPDQNLELYLVDGAAIEFPTTVSLSGTSKQFVGWTTVDNAEYSHATIAPEFVTSATATADVTYYAVFADVTDNGYTKVASAPEDWSGDYILAYDNSATQAYVFTGVDAVSNYVTAEVSSNSIAALPTGGVTITIAAIPETTNYSIMVNGGTNDGKYLQGSAGNGLNFQVTEQANQITWHDTYGLYFNNSSSYLRYNSTGNQTRFRYYKSATYTQSGYNAISLYKHSTTTSNYATTVAQLDHIAITTAPTTGYKVGETLDLENMVVKAYYGTDETGVEISDYTVSIEAETALTTEHASFTVTYSEGGLEKTANQAIHVYELSGIAVTAAPGETIKTDYKDGQSFDKSKIVVTATWGGDAEDHIVEAVAAANYVVSPDPLVYNSTTQVVVSYTHEGTLRSAAPIDVTVADRDHYVVTWNVAGVETTTKYYVEDDALVVKADPEVPEGFEEGFEFMGWTKAESINKDGSEIDYAHNGDKLTEATTYRAVFAKGETTNGYKVGTAAPADGETVIIARLVESTYYALNYNGTSLTTTALSVTDGFAPEPADEVLWDIKDATTGVFIHPTGEDDLRIHINSKEFKVATGETNGDVVFSANSSNDSYKAARSDNQRWIGVSGETGLSYTDAESNAAELYIFKSHSVTNYSNYRFAPSTLVAPVIELANGTYYGAQEVTITQSQGKPIYYSKNEGDWTLYEDAIQLTENEEVTIAAKAYDEADDDYSTIAEAAYTIFVSIDAPTITAASSFVESKTVEISHAMSETEGFELFYSYDGENYVAYTEALEITETKTVYAKATIASLVAEASATYTKIEATIYNKLTSDSELAVGMQFLIASGNHVAGEPNSMTAQTYLKYVDIAPINNKLYVGEEAVQVFTLDGLPGAWSLGIGNGKYLVPSGGDVKAMSSTSGEWSIAIASGGAPTITCESNVSSNKNYNTIKYNSGSPRFKTYTADGNQDDLTALYYLPYGTTYTVRYNDESGNELKSVKVIEGYEYKLVLSDPGDAPEGYEFMNSWTDGTNVYNIGDVVEVNSAIILKPRWKVTPTGNAQGEIDVADVPDQADVIVEEGKTLIVDEEKVLNDVTVKAGATVTVNEAVQANDMTVEVGGTITGTENVSVRNLVIKTKLETITDAESTTDKAGASGQIESTGEISATNDAVIEIELTQDAEASWGWYAFSVPFPVDAMSGVYYGDTQLQNEVGYAIMKYHEDKRAAGEYAWKKYRETLLPGVLYFITVGDTDYKTLRFKKVSGEAIVASNAVSVSYTAASGEGASGWNGIGNPNLQVSHMDGDLLFFDHTNRCFRKRSGMNLMVGSAFMYQTGDGQSVVIETGAAASLAPSRVESSIEKTTFEVLLRNVATGRAEDNVFLRTSETALSTYEIGRDLGKIQMSECTDAQMYIPAYGTELCIADFPMVNGQVAYPLTINSPAAGNYRLSTAASNEADIYLTLDGNIIWNLSMSPYELELPKGITEGYGLLLQAKAPSVATGVESAEANEAGVQKVIIEDKVFILRGGQMYDVTGKAVR